MRLPFKKKTPPQDHRFDLHRALPNPAYAQALPEPKAAFPWRKTLKRSALGLAVLLLLVGGWLGWKWYVNTAKVFGGNPFGFLTSTTLRGESSGRVNILLIGYSDDDPNHGGADLTDSIMLVSINTKTNKAFLLSVPRDLYVNVYGNYYGKINEAYEDGNSQKFSQAGYPNGGVGLLESLVSQKLQVPIDYYALINYTAFRDMVNAVGGVTVDIESSDPRGLYDPNIAIADGGPLKLANGSQTLNGQTALNLARARGDSYYSYGFPAADFDRTAHQRQMLVALKGKIASAGTLSNPIKISNLLDALGNNVKTDLSTPAARRLYDVTNKVSDSNIASATVNGTKDNVLLKSYRTASGQSALIPARGVDDYSAIQAYVAQLESSN